MQDKKIDNNKDCFRNILTESMMFFYCQVLSANFTFVKSVQTRLFKDANTSSGFTHQAFSALVVHHCQALEFVYRSKRSELFNVSNNCQDIRISNRQIIHLIRIITASYDNKLF